MVNTIVHEFGHSFVNPHVYANAGKLQSAVDQLYPRVAARMTRMAYGNSITMTHESIVRAVQVRYFSEKAGPEAAAHAIREETNRGFLWTADLANLLSQYEEQRYQYPTFGDFFPRIIDYFVMESRKPLDPETVKAMEPPTIVSVTPGLGETNVDPALTELVVVFDRDMMQSFSWCGGGDTFPKVPEGARAFWRNPRTCVLPVELKPGHTYHLGLNAPSFRGFQSADGVALNPVSYTFTTRGTWMER